MTEHQSGDNDDIDINIIELENTTAQHTLTENVYTKV